ncbi:MAG: hypothetical protein HY611_08855 [Elusimicrobia bacterium]|nr:hypothetical protein [Elusimicrobiota bacterium]
MKRLGGSPKRLLRALLPLTAGWIFASFFPGVLQAQVQLYIQSLRVGFETGQVSGSCSNIPGTGLCDLSSRSLADPRLEFENRSPGSSAYPNNYLYLCAQIGYTNNTTAVLSVDSLQMDVFKFVPGGKALDEESTPALHTVFFYNVGSMMATTVNGTLPSGSHACTRWDGAYNIEGEFGKTNGQYGFRATVQTNTQSDTAGNVEIKQTSAYPGESQYPIKVDVVNLHVVRSSPTPVGSGPTVAGQPYNITYRISKDASVTIKIFDSSLNVIRTVVSGLPRPGEGVPDGTLRYSDAWDGRNDRGNIVPAGVYIAEIKAQSTDFSGTDVSDAVYRQVSLDPLQITDVKVFPLLATSTSRANISFMLTEPATTYLDIWTPGTVFSDVNAANPAGSGGTLLRRIIEQQRGLSSVSIQWDGRDFAGNTRRDGNYVYSLYARLPSADNSGNPVDILTSKPKFGLVPVARGLIEISQVVPSFTSIGSSPSVGGLRPFSFRYLLSREAVVSVKVLKTDGFTVVKTLVDKGIRPGDFLNSEPWSTGTGDDGRHVEAGNYLVQLTAEDPQVPSQVSTTTAQFSLNLFRITDLNVSPLLSGASDSARIEYQLSESMEATINIYPPGTVINSDGTWPPTSAEVRSPTGGPVSAVKTITGVRPGRLRVSEPWEGRNFNGVFVQDGEYPFTLTAKSTTTPVFYAADRVIGVITVARGNIEFASFRTEPSIAPLFNSSGTVALPPYEINFTVTRQSSVTVQILNTVPPIAPVKTLLAGAAKSAFIPHKEFWDARDDSGRFVKPGFYTVRVTAIDLASELTSGSTKEDTLSVDPLRIFDVAVAPLTEQGSAEIHYQVSETMRTVVKIFKPGTTFDRQGNASPPESISLVKRFVGIRPKLSEITQPWDGTDEQLSIVPDGNYLFRIIGSTNPNAVDSITGDILDPNSILEDLVLSDVAVVRASSFDPEADFADGTYIYPNPVTADTAKVRIWVPTQARVFFKIFTLNGDLVYDKDLGEWPGGTTVQSAPNYVVWNRDNQAGKKLARGVYFAVIREEGTTGNREVFQTVKKILIP